MAKLEAKNIINNQSLMSQLKQNFAQVAKNIVAQVETESLGRYIER